MRWKNSGLSTSGTCGEGDRGRGRQEAGGWGQNEVKWSGQLWGGGTDAAAAVLVCLPAGDDGQGLLVRRGA